MSAQLIQGIAATGIAATGIAAMGITNTGITDTGITDMGIATKGVQRRQCPRLQIQPQHLLLAENSAVSLTPHNCCVGCRCPSGAFLSAPLPSAPRFSSGGRPSHSRRLRWDGWWHE